MRCLLPGLMRTLWCAAVALGALASAGTLRAQPSSPPALAALLAGRWTPEAGGGCGHVFQFQLAGDRLRVTAPDGKVDVQRVLRRRGAGLAAETIESVHGIPKGTKWVYEVLAPGQLSVTGGAGQSAEFQHCHDPIPATATPSEFLQGMFDLYAADADSALPFASDAGLDAFLVPDLADQIRRDLAKVRQGDGTDRACLTVDPITGSSVDYQVRNVSVTVAAPGAATPDRTAGTVSFRNMGEARRMTFDLRRTAAGWRIDDLRAGTAPSLRQVMAPCAAAGH